MSETPQDPWKAVGLELLKLKDTRTIEALLRVINEAQAAEATQHQQFKEAVATALCVENEHGPVTEESIVEAADATLSQLFDFSARLAAVEAERDLARCQLADIAAGGSKSAKCVVEMATELIAVMTARNEAEAERDKQAEQIAMLLTICPNCAGLMAPEPPDSGCSGVYCPECRSDSAELRAERDRLKAANERLERLVKSQRPELSQLRDIEVALRDYLQNGAEQLEQTHALVQSLLPPNDDDLPTFGELRGIMSAALTPQSTDGETR